MKRIITVFFLIVMTLSICGCEEPEFDIETDGWELWMNGVVDKTSIEVYGNTRKFIVEFEGDLRLEASYLHNYNDIKVGQSGNIYKYSAVDANYYLWEPDKTQNTKEETHAQDESDITPFEGKKVANPQEYPIEEIKNTDTQTKNIFEWQKTGSKPTPYQTVLVKFKNGLTTTAYQTPTGDWKADTDRTKLSGGIALKNIDSWKQIDLE